MNHVLRTLACASLAAAALLIGCADRKPSPTLTATTSPSPGASTQHDHHGGTMAPAPAVTAETPAHDAHAGMHHDASATPAQPPAHGAHHAGMNHPPARASAPHEKHAHGGAAASRSGNHPAAHAEPAEHGEHSGHSAEVRAHVHATPAAAEHASATTHEHTVNESSSTHDHAATADPHAGHATMQRRGSSASAAMDAGISAPSASLTPDPFDAPVAISVAEAARARMKAVDDAPPEVAAPRGAPALYTCPMHPEVTSAKPGHCHKCGMSLVKKEQQ